MLEMGIGLVHGHFQHLRLASSAECKSWIPSSVGGYGLYEYSREILVFQPGIEVVLDYLEVVMDWLPRMHCYT